MLHFLTDAKARMGWNYFYFDNILVGINLSSCLQNIKIRHFLGIELRLEFQRVPSGQCEIR